MLIIRREQMTIFENRAHRDFQQRLLTFLRTTLPEATVLVEDNVLCARIDDSQRRAAKYGIVTDASVAQFVCLTFVAGPAFDELPEVQSYLQEPDTHPEQQLEALVDYLAALEDEANLEH